MTLRKHFGGLFRQPTIDEVLAAQQSTTAQKPPAWMNLLTLGDAKEVDSGLHALDTGMYTPSGLVVIAEDVSDKGTAIIGEVGSGKTSALYQIAAQFARSTDRDIIAVNGKGDEDFAQRMRAILYRWRGLAVPIVRLGTGRPGAKYHGLKGDALTIYNRLVKFAGIEELKGEATFWAELHRNGLQLMCFAPHGPPQSFAEVAERLHPHWLNTTYVHDKEKLLLVKDVLTARGNQGSGYRNLALLLMPILTELGGVIDPTGYALEDGSLIFSVRTESVPNTAKRFFSLWVEDAKDYLGKRQKKAALFLIDEFHAFDNESITWLLSMARVFNVAVVIATQSTMSLGPDLQQRLLMSNTTTVIAFRTQYPEEICKRAGTKPETTHSMQHEYGVMTGLGNSRTEEAWRIHPNAIRQLPTGYAYVIRQGTYACVHFHQVTDIANVPAEPDYTPAPPPPPAEEPPVMELK